MKPIKISNILSSFEIDSGFIPNKPMSNKQKQDKQKKKKPDYSEQRKAKRNYD